MKESVCKILPSTGLEKLEGWHTLRICGSSIARFILKMHSSRFVMRSRERGIEAENGISSHAIHVLC